MRLFFKGDFSSGWCRLILGGRQVGIPFRGFAHQLSRNANGRLTVPKLGHFADLVLFIGNIGQPLRDPRWIIPNQRVGPDVDRHRTFRVGTHRQAWNSQHGGLFLKPS